MPPHLLAEPVDILHLLLLPPRRRLLLHGAAVDHPRRGPQPDLDPALLGRRGRGSGVRRRVNTLDQKHSPQVNERAKS